ncbi:hypothetical protein DFJ73DRAFT_848590 [Zopfochytrium polystomum]|nr:hypothetical protein DFJ73DRAFT_848590 [Zopfochytrium polystomum]
MGSHERETARQRDRERECVCVCQEPPDPEMRRANHPRKRSSAPTVQATPSPPFSLSQWLPHHQQQQQEQRQQPHVVPPPSPSSPQAPLPASGGAVLLSSRRRPLHAPPPPPPPLPYLEAGRTSPRSPYSSSRRFPPLPSSHSEPGSLMRLQPSTATGEQTPLPLHQPTALAALAPPRTPPTLPPSTSQRLTRTGHTHQKSAASARA